MGFENVLNEKYTALCLSDKIPQNGSTSNSLILHNNAGEHITLLYRQGDGPGVKPTDARAALTC